VDGDVQRRLALVARWTGPNRPDYASINMNEPGIDELADLLLSLGIGIEAGVWTPVDARVLETTGFSDRLVRVLLEPEEPTSAAAVATAAAVADGQDIRIGLEDTTVLPDGTQASGNADLVAAAALLIPKS